VRLRELGCRVTGYGQQGKSGRDIERDYERVYDQFEVIGPGKARPAVRATSRAAAPPEATAPAAPARARARRPAARVAIPVPLTAALEAPAESPAARPTAPRRRPAAKTLPAAQALLPAAAVPRVLPAAVEAVLEACPDLRGGAAVRLNGVAVALRERGLLTKSGKTTSFFKKLDSHFALLPIEKPESVRFLGAAPSGD